MPTNVLIFPGRGGNPHLVGLYKKAHPDLDIDVAATLDEAEAKLPHAEIFMSWGLPRDIFANAKNLKWVHSLGTGVNGLVDAPSLSKDVIVTATRGIHGAPMSEAAFMLMLNLARDFVRSVRQQDNREWQRFAPQLLRGKTVGVVGTGMIAQDFAPRCKAFGMKVVGFSRSERPIPGFDEVRPRETLAASAPEIDFLVLLVPLDSGTKGLVNAEILKAMKSTAFLINLARGAIIDDDALLAALRDGSIAGAALDTFVEEPLPRDHPYWSAPNTIVTGHLGGYCDETEQSMVDQFSENLKHYLAGDIDAMTFREAR